MCTCVLHAKKKREMWLNKCPEPLLCLKSTSVCAAKIKIVLSEKCIMPSTDASVPYVLYILKHFFLKRKIHYLTK